MKEVDIRPVIKIRIQAKNHGIKHMVKLEIKEQVAWITLSRPEKQNALSFEMFQQLASTIKQIRKDKSLRAAVITGDGNHFSSGTRCEERGKFPLKNCPITL
nr:enoyl-CoA hydratase-related protein [Pseudoalteromonas xiamenensis]